MKGTLKKLLIIVGLFVVIGLGALIDLGISKSYTIEFVSVQRLSEEPAYDADGDEIPLNWGIADGQTQVRFVVKLTRNGKAVEGHTLYVKTNRNVLERINTDEQGMAVIDYRCYKGRAGRVTPIILTVSDEDNSVFVSVPKRASYTLQMAEPVTESGSGMKTDDIFYDIEE